MHAETRGQYQTGQEQGVLESSRQRGSSFHKQQLRIIDCSQPAALQSIALMEGCSHSSIVVKLTSQVLMYRVTNFVRVVEFGSCKGEQTWHSW